MPLSAEEFLERLRASGLLAEPDIAAAAAEFMEATPSADAGQLAEAMVARGCLTPYQASVLREGRAVRLVLGKYVIREELGEGGMGRVFKARHRYMDRVVALKTLPDALAESPESKARFQREARAAARLDHPNIVKAFDADECDGTPLLIMECIEGTDLATRLHRHGPLSVEQAIEVVRQTAEGLAYAHARGMVHRDVKPSNLMLDPHGVVKILDLGLARLLRTGADGESSMQTMTGRMTGTVDFMSPEQAEDMHRADARSDVYSLGCTLWTLLTGTAVYPGDSIEQRLVGHLEAPIPSLRAVRADVPEWVDRLFRQMAAKRPEDRPQSMDEVLAALANPKRRAKAGRPGAGGGLLRAWPALAAAGCLGVLLLLAVAAVDWRGDRAAVPPDERPAQSVPPAAPVLIADSTAEFSGVQGQDHWYYGYYDGTSDAPYSQRDFVEFPRYDGTRWSISDRYWTDQSATRFAPNGRITSFGRQPAEHWSVRRWVSPIEGEILIEGALRKCGPGASGDGVTGRIVIDGHAVWLQSIAANDDTGVQYSVRGTVRRGSRVDFSVAPNINDWEDTTVFTARIFHIGHRYSPAPVSPMATR